jgi:hypothetical protein
VLKITYWTVNSEAWLPKRKPKRKAIPAAGQENRALNAQAGATSATLLCTEALTALSDSQRIVIDALQQKTDEKRLKICDQEKELEALTAKSDFVGESIALCAAEASCS